MDRLNKRITLISTGMFVVFLIAGSFLFMPHGEAIFKEEDCITCHRFKGKGGMTGPDLTGVTDRRSTLWLMRQISNSRSHNPDSRMPVYDRLSYIEIWSIISYLKSG